jgi:pimeloyl-ACP methyl ester carboxylesterase
MGKRSTRLPGRTVARAADDVAVLVGRLSWDRFALWGASGGGPHVLAGAAHR